MEKGGKITLKPEKLHLKEQKHITFNKNTKRTRTQEKMQINIQSEMG